MADIKYTDSDGTVRYSHSTKTGALGDPDSSPEDIVTALAAGATAAAQTTGNASLASIAANNATAANQTAQNTLIGAVTETAPASDIAPSGLNGRLQRIAQRLTSLIALLPTALSNGFFQVSVKETITLPVSNAPMTSIDTKTPALGQAVAAASVPVILPTATITTLTPPSAITGFATVAKQPALGTAGTPSTDVITVQGIASGVAQVVSLAFPAASATSRAAISTATSGDNTIVAGVAAKTVRIHKLIITSVASPVTILFKDGASTTLLTWVAPTNGGIVLDFDGEPWFITTAANAFVINLSAAVQIYGRCYFTQS